MAYRVKDINTTVQVTGASPSRVVVIGGTAYFSATEPHLGTELWRERRHRRRHRRRQGPQPLGSSNPPALTDVNGTLYFNADDGVHGHELWKSDGTEAGTVLVKDISVSSGAPSRAN